MIEHGAIRLSPYVRSLRQILFQWLNDPEVRRSAGEFRMMSEFDLDAWIARMAHTSQNTLLMVVERERGTPVGFAVLTDASTVHRHARLGLAIADPAWRGRGLGSDALAAVLRHGFADLALERIHLEVLCSNARAIRLYERHGFRHEGVRRNHYYVDGAFRDVLGMGILRSDGGSPPPP